MYRPVHCAGDGLHDGGGRPGEGRHPAQSAGGGAGPRRGQQVEHCCTSWTLKTLSSAGPRWRWPWLPASSLYEQKGQYDVDNIVLYIIVAAPVRFVFSHVADEGWIDGQAGPLLRYRRNIGATQVGCAELLSALDRTLHSAARWRCWPI